MTCRLLLIVLLPLLLTASVSQAAQPTAKKPNVIVIYTDDQGTLDANCYGSKDLITPTFDRLADEGVRFTQMYSPSAICSASRAGLLTGRFPVRAGVPSNVSSTKGVAGMPTSELTLAELMKSQGYRTGHVGKWHLGYTPETMPLGQGFESSLGHMGGCIDNYSHFFYWQGPNRHDMWRDGQEVFLDGEYFGDVMVDECQRLISEWKDEPFFIYWAINWPHYPLQGAAKWRETYSELESPRREYAAFVSSMDERIGWVVNHLEELGLREDTLIVLQSDHGHSVEERTFFGGGNPGPYRGAKGCLFEAGIRVPAIASWPAGIPKGQVRDQMAVGCDWMPTIAEIIGAGEQPQCDGKSLAKVIADANAPSPHDSLYWHLGKGTNVQWVVRKGPWKLLGNPKDNREPKSLAAGQQLFLANLDDDPSEQTDLSKHKPQIVSELQQLRQIYLDSLVHSAEQ